MRHEVHLISDLGKTSWQLDSSAAQESLQKQTAKINELAGLMVYDVGQPEAPNLAVTHSTLVRLTGDAEVKFATVQRG